MVVLLYFDFFGILSSILVNLCLTIGLSLPAGQIAVLLNIGIGAVVGTRLFVTKELRQGKGWLFNDRMKNICPYWLKSGIALIIIYGVLNSIFALSRTFSMLSVGMTKEDAAIASKKLFIGVFSLIMICYAIEFLLVYLYQIIKEAEIQKPKSERPVL